MGVLLSVARSLIKKRSIRRNTDSAVNFKRTKEKVHIVDMSHMDSESNGSFDFDFDGEMDSFDDNVPIIKIDKNM